MKNLTMLCISLFISSHSLACEPASLNWEQFHKTYDLNKNKTFELKEFLSVKDFDPLPWPDDKRFQAKDKNFGGVSKSMIKKSRLNFDKIEKCK